MQMWILIRIIKRVPERVLIEKTLYGKRSVFSYFKFQILWYNTVWKTER